MQKDQRGSKRIKDNEKECKRNKENEEGSNSVIKDKRTQECK